MKKRKDPLDQKQRKHDKLVNDYTNQKNKHLEKMAGKMLENDEKFRKLGEKKSKGNFLDLF